MKLYGYWRSSSAWRVRIGLALKVLSYEYVAVHLVRDGGHQYSAEHVARNPMAQVPVLEVEGPGGPVFLSQSLAILAWLDATHPEPALLPAEPFARARTLQLAEMINSGIQPLQNLTVLRSVEDLGGERMAWGREVIGRGFDALETLAGTGPFFVGSGPTMADLFLVPQMYNARRFGVDLDPYPNLRRIEAACVELPAFQVAHPDRQPDAVP
jgi:maleylpyruvate isomerase